MAMVRGRHETVSALDARGVRGGDSSRAWRTAGCSWTASPTPSIARNLAEGRGSFWSPLVHGDDLSAIPRASAARLLAAVAGGFASSATICSSSALYCAGGRARDARG